MRATSLLGVVLSAGLLVGCGSSGGLSKSAEALLQRDAAALASAARAGNPTAVAAALARLRTDLAAQQSSGDVSAARAERVLTAAMAVAGEVRAPVKPTVAPTPTATRAPVVRAPAPSRESERGKGKGKSDDGDEGKDD